MTPFQSPPLWPCSLLLSCTPAWSQWPAPRLRRSKCAPWTLALPAARNAFPILHTTRPSPQPSLFKLLVKEAYSAHLLPQDPSSLMLLFLTALIAF